MLELTGPIEARLDESKNEIFSSLCSRATGGENYVNAGAKDNNWLTNDGLVDSSGEADGTIQLAYLWTALKWEPETEWDEWRMNGVRVAVGLVCGYLVWTCCAALVGLVGALR
ncbi:12586_t:CDS:2, partial [Acaulospora colombiana]